MSRFRYQPGETTRRQFAGYSEYQEALWQAFADAYYSEMGGYATTRMPAPGPVFDMGHFREWRSRAIAAWDAESHRGSFSRGAEQDDYPEQLWLYLYERFMAVPLKLDRDERWG